jgi:hypothetical protein
LFATPTPTNTPRPTLTPTPTNTPRPTPTPTPTPTLAPAEIGTPTVGRRGEWELTISSVEYHDSIAINLGGRLESNPGESFLAVGFSLRSLGEARVKDIYLNWFQITNAEGNTFLAHQLSPTGDTGDFSPYEVEHMEMTPPASFLGNLLLFSIPTSAGALTFEFKGDLDEFPPVYLGD